MAENLTFARPPSDEAWHPEVSIHAEKEFYSATGTDTQEVFRFVAASTNATAADAVEEFSAVAAKGDVIAGYLGPHVHDDKEKEYFDAVAVGDAAPIVYDSVKPVIVEADSGITAGELAPMTELTAEVDGTAALLSTSGGGTEHVAAYALEAFDVTTDDGVTTTYVRCLLARTKKEVTIPA